MAELSVDPDVALDTLPPGVPELTLGWGVIEWAMTLFIQPDGPKAGKAWRPTDRQIRFILWFYAINEDGEFIYRHAVRRLAKGSGKSPFAAFMSLCEFCGPVRFKGWDTSKPGGAVGMNSPMPLVQIAATNESQTKNTNRYVREMCGKGSLLQIEFDIDPGKTVNYKPGGGQLEIITSSSTGAEGAQPSFVVADETEHWLTSNGGVGLFETLDRNLRKSNSRMLETCNAWAPGAGSVAEATWDAFVAQEEGKTRGKKKILYDAVEAPADTELDNEESLIAALEAVYADCPWVDIQGIAEGIWSPTAKADVSRRYYLNQRVSSETSWTTPVKWAALANPSHVVADKEPIVMFFDGSKSGDATALTGCEVESGHVFSIGVWEPKDGQEVDAADVDRMVLKAFEKYNVVAFFGDVREWESFVKTTWALRYEDDLVLWSLPNGSPPLSIAYDMRQRTNEFAQAAEEVAAEIEAGLFTHDGSSVMARHVGNAQRRPYKQWVTIAKDSPKSSAKIDAAITVIGARMLRKKLLGSTEWQKYLTRKNRKKKAYSF